MRPEDRILYLLRERLDDAIRQSSDALRARRVKPTGEQRTIIPAGVQQYYIELLPVMAVRDVIDKLLEDDSA